MESLPIDLLDEIFFKLDRKSLARVQGTNRSLRSHISQDPYFDNFLQTNSRSLHISAFASKILFWHSSLMFRSNINKDLVPRGLLASCSGLFLLFGNGLCVASHLENNKYQLRSIDHSESKLLRGVITWVRSLRRSDTKRWEEFELNWNRANRMGFAVDPITQRFNVVCIAERKKASNHDETMYVFEVNSGDSSWKLSETTVTCSTSILMPDNKPVYCNGYVHWLRNDGSIVGFNPETEQARLIKAEPPWENWEKAVLAGEDKELNLVIATEEVACVYALDLEVVDTDPKWVLVKRIRCRESQGMSNFYIAGHEEGECLVVKEKKEERFVHVYGRDFLSCQDMIMKRIGGIDRHALKVLRTKKRIYGEDYRKVWKPMNLELMHKPTRD